MLAASDPWAAGAGPRSRRLLAVFNPDRGRPIQRRLLALRRLQCVLDLRDFLPVAAHEKLGPSLLNVIVQRRRRILVWERRDGFPGRAGSGIANPRFATATATKPRASLRCGLERAALCAGRGLHAGATDLAEKRISFSCRQGSDSGSRLICGFVESVRNLCAANERGAQTGVCAPQVQPGNCGGQRWCWAR